MRFSPAVLQHADARGGQRLTTALDLDALGSPAHLQIELNALRDDMALQGRRVARSLFIGPPGHGQALAAASLGRAVGLAVFRVDLSTVISKYIGETEKNLERLFGNAEAANAILFLDEADALFGRRTDVHDAHDRYANLEASCLVRELEEYRGPAILATSSRMHVDPAFLRRVRHVLYFHSPLRPPKT